MDPTPSPQPPEPPAVSDVEPLPVRMLNEFVYCPRLFYYEHVEGVFRHNADTKRGAALHARVDAGKGALPPATPAENQDASENSDAKSPAPSATDDVIHSRSVSLSSDRLGVTAKMDLVEVRPAAASEWVGNGAGDLLAPLTVCPVDYKIGAPREGDHGPEIWDADRMQLGLNA